MNPPPQQPGKRIVSKSEYAKLRSKQVCLGVSGVFLMLVMVIAGFAAIVLAISLLPLAVASSFGGSTLTMVFLLLLLTILLGVSAYFAGKWGGNNVLRSESIVPGVPLTRSNVADLPAPDSLVRASQKPTRAQQTTLLRAAAPDAQAQEEQLLRPTAGQ